MPAPATKPSTEVLTSTRMVLTSTRVAELRDERDRLSVLGVGDHLRLALALQLS